MVPIFTRFTAAVIEEAPHAAGELPSQESLQILPLSAKSHEALSALAGQYVRTLSEQVALETRTRMLNPKWYEGMLKHGYEGVRQIEEHLTNTMGWSATTGQVQPWVYQQMSETFMLDPAMRERLARLNPTASARVANRLLEASERNFWQPAAAELAALRQAGEELEDRLEGAY